MLLAYLKIMIWKIEQEQLELINDTNAGRRSFCWKNRTVERGLVTSNIEGVVCWI